MQVLHQASTEVKALKRKFEQQEAQGQQPSAKRALVAEPDPATDSPRILSCQRWQVPPSPISARNQQEQPGEGAAGPKAPTPPPRLPTSLTTCGRCAHCLRQAPWSLRRPLCRHRRRRPHSAHCMACLAPQQAPAPAPPPAPGQGLALWQLQQLLQRDRHLQRRRQRRQEMLAARACATVAPPQPPAPLCSLAGSQRCTGTAAAGWVWPVVIDDIGMREIVSSAS